MQIKKEENNLNVYIKIFFVRNTIRADKLKVCYRLRSSKSNFLFQIWLVIAVLEKVIFLCVNLKRYYLYTYLFKYCGFRF